MFKNNVVSSIIFNISLEFIIEAVCEGITERGLAPSTSKSKLFNSKTTLVKKS